MLKVIISHTPRDYEKMYYSHNKSFWGVRGKVSSNSKWLEKAELGKWLWGLLQLGVGMGVSNLKRGLASCIV